MGGGLNGQDAYSGRIIPVAHTLRAEGFDAGEDGTGRGVPLVAFTASEQVNGFAWESEVWQTLNAQVPNDTSNVQQGIRQNMAVRRLTPRECERLQGFPDDWTLVPYRGKPVSDGPRYKAIGNSWPVNVARWVGRRIEMVEEICQA
jgi:DNA (cytosine-5)-methyltransferase 1